MNIRNAAPAAIVLVLAVASCTPPDEVAPSGERPKIAFDGQPDEKLAGTWKTKDGRMTYELNKDGKFSLAGKVSTQGGTFDHKATGEWSVSGDRLLIKDAAGIVAPYTHKLAGDRLVLTSTGSMKNETTLVRKK